MTVSLILTWLLTGIAGFFSDQEVDFSPRLLHKEASAIFNNKAYRVSELTLGGSSSLNGKFFTFRSEGGESITAYIGRVNSCRAGGCSNPADHGIDVQYEYFDYFILFDTLNNVKVVRVFNYEATHGQEVTIKKWLDQFAGYDGNKPLRVGKEVDSISGATMSVNAIVSDVKEKTNLLARGSAFPLHKP